MTADLLGVRPAAATEWRELCAALDGLLDVGFTVACRAHPESWSSDARPLVRQDAAEACGHCPARCSCLAFAVANREQQGVWGGRDHTPTGRTTA